MSSDVQSAVETVILTNYVSLVVMTAVIYDYVLTFTSEVEYIWCKPWTWVSTMFVIVRYIGLPSAMAAALGGSSFVPGPLKVSTVVYLGGLWTFTVFLFAADLVMIQRVYAMWNRSRAILFFLTAIYVVQFITSIVLNAIYNNPNTYFSVSIIHASDFSYCNYSFVQLLVNVFVVAPRLFLAAMLVFLALIQTLKQSISMYKSTRRWQVNRYIRLLTKDGIVYFFVNVLFQITSLLIQEGNVGPTTIATLLVLTVAYITFYTLIPRFIISIRELYARDGRGRLHIDTGFGARSQSTGETMVVSAIVFEDGGLHRQDPGVEGDRDNSADIEMGRVRGSADESTSRGLPER